jgi:hypothetical protein
MCVYKKGTWLSYAKHTTSTEHWGDPSDGCWGFCNLDIQGLQGQKFEATFDWEKSGQNPEHGDFPIRLQNIGFFVFDENVDWKQTRQIVNEQLLWILELNKTHKYLSSCLKRISNNPLFVNKMVETLFLLFHCVLHFIVSKYSDGI